MSFLCNIKYSNVTNLSDARYAAAVGMNYIGFCFDATNPNYITPIKAKEISDWLTGSFIVAEFGDQPLNDINDISELLQVDVIELENRLLPDEVATLEKPVIKKINTQEFSFDQLITELNAYQNVCDAFHLYASSNSFSDTELKQLCSNFKIIWGLPYTMEGVITLIHTYQPFAISINGGEEEVIGMKDFDDINDLIERLTTEDTY